MTVLKDAGPPERVMAEVSHAGPVAYLLTVRLHVILNMVRLGGRKGRRRGATTA